MPPVEITHPVYGTRTVAESQVDYKLRTGWSKGGEVAPEEVAGSVADVLDKVGDDSEKARVALVAEQSRNKPRTSLVTALARIAEPDTKES